MRDQDTNQRGLDLIKAAESFRPTRYRCPAGIWTIGYGTTAAAGFDIMHMPTPITRVAAERMLSQSLDRLYEPAIENGVKVALNDNEFSALASFVYNVGPGAFAKSGLLRKLNAGDKAGAGAELMKWTKGGGRVLRGLVVRRRAERELFLTPVARPGAAPVAAAVASRLEAELKIDEAPMAQRVEPIEALPVRLLEQLDVRFDVADYLAAFTDFPLMPVFDAPLSQVIDGTKR